MPANNIKINMWAGMVALTSCWILIATSIPTFFYKDKLGIAVYALVVAIILLPFVYPLRQLGPVLIVVQGQFYVTAALMFAFSIGTFFAVPTSLGGMSLIVAGVMYVIAGIRKEQAETCETLSAPPRQARE